MNFKFDGMAEFNLKGNQWLGLIGMVIFFIALFFIATSVLKILSYVAPVFLLGALLINHKTVTGYGKMLIRLLKRNPLGGVLAIILTVVGFPIVAIFLFGMAILQKKVGKMVQEAEQRQQGELVEYEEIVEEETEILELPQLEEAEPESDYEELFGEDT